MASKYRKKEEANTSLTLEAFRTLFEKHREVQPTKFQRLFGHLGLKLD